MARPASIALGGYFSTPPDQLHLVLELLTTTADMQEVNRTRCTILDPCAGQGHAVAQITTHILSKHRGIKATIYACELEKERHQAIIPTILAGGFGSSVSTDILYGDAFHVEASKNSIHTASLGVDILFLNPPYTNGVDERAFLERFTPFMRDTGILIYIVPFSVVHKTADFLATWFDRVEVRRFTDDAYSAFKQCVVIARKKLYPSDAMMIETSAIYQTLTTLTEDAVLPLTVPFATPMELHILKAYNHGLYKWKMKEYDQIGLHRAIRPFLSPKGTAFDDVGVSTGIDAMIGQVMPVAMPLRPAHIAEALAVGMFNGHVLHSDTATFPPIIIKGVYQRGEKLIETKTNKDGEFVGHVVKQVPELSLTVLDVTTGDHGTIKRGIERSADCTPMTMTIADFVHHYKTALLALLDRQFPALHDHRKPEHRLSLPVLDRPLFVGQEPATNTLLKLLAQGKHGELLGKVGTGKGSIMLAVAVALSPPHFEEIVKQLEAQGFDQARKHLRPVRRVLYVCPPHLISNFADEIRAVIPTAAIRVIDSISSVHQPFDDDRLTIMILDRETAKLGHKEIAVFTCPRCGTAYRPDGDRMVRAYCNHTIRRPTNDHARFLMTHMHVLSRLSGVHVRNPVRFQQKSLLVDQWLLYASNPHVPFEQTRMYPVVDYLWTMADAVEPMNASERSSIIKGLIGLLIALDLHPDRNRWLADRLITYCQASFAADQSMTDSYANKQRRAFAESCLPLLDQTWQSVLDVIKSTIVQSSKYSYGYRTPTIEQEVTEWFTTTGYSSLGLWRRAANGEITLDDRHIHCVNGIQLAHDTIAHRSQWHTVACREPLWQSIPEPRRYPLARYIAQHTHNLFDLLLIDEKHEYNSNASAQQFSKNRLIKAAPMVIQATGTFMNGYAENVFISTWESNADFRKHYNRDDVTAFVKQYGFRKLMVDTLVDGKEEAILEIGRGSVSDRRDTNEHRVMRSIGRAEGIMPMYSLQFLLPHAAMIDMEDLMIDLPAYSETPIPVTTRHDVIAEYGRAKEAIKRQIGKDRFTPDAGKLFGALGQLPSYLDRASVYVGNEGETGKRVYRVYHPTSDNLIASPATYQDVLPKEQTILDIIQREYDEGRNILLLATHTGGQHGVDRHWLRLVHDAIAPQCAIILDAKKVKTHTRKAWIQTNVVNAGKRILIANPVTIQTGLNNLVYFNTIVWLENPNCNPFVFRQTNGRIFRIGQTQETRVYFPYYADTAQELAKSLLGHKVKIASGVDGMDLVASLAGIGASDDDAYAGYELGQLIYESV